MTGNQVRVIALGSPHGGDDEVMLGVAEALEAAVGVEVIIAGRPGPGLVELLAPAEVPVVLLDVVRSGSAAGTIHAMGLGELRERGLASDPVSSHGFGPAEALKLAEALGRPLPDGVFVGVEGEQFTIGAEPSSAVAAALPRVRARVAAAIADLLGNQENQRA